MFFFSQFGDLYFLYNFRIKCYNSFEILIILIQLKKSLLKNSKIEILFLQKGIKKKN